VSPGGDRHETGLRALEALGGPAAAAGRNAQSPPVGRVPLSEDDGGPGIDAVTRELFPAALNGVAAARDVFTEEH
jgi:hypothetical protein